MSIHAETPDGLESLSNKALVSMLEGLEEEERLLSRRRRALHAKIDGLLEGQCDVADAATESLGTLQDSERRVSERRLHVHQRIAELRIERGRRLRGLRASLALVE